MPYADPAKAREYAAQYARDRRNRLKAAGEYVAPTRTPEQRARASESARRKRAERAAAPGKSRESELRRLKALRYRMKPDAFEAWYQKTFAEQAGACAVCRVPFTAEAPAKRGGAKGVPYVDHDHETGRVRALVCTGCNIAIGYAEKSPERMIASVEYLLKHTEARLTDLDNG